MLKTNYVTALNDAERRLRRGLLTLQEYRECENAIVCLYNGKIATTICEKVKDFVSLYGVHTDVSGIGWKMIDLPYKSKEQKYEYEGM